MFRTVLPSIIGISGLYIQQQVYVKQILLFAASRKLAANNSNLYPKHVECYSKINKFEKLVHLVGFL
jgi:hypothetical protein